MLKTLNILAICLLCIASATDTNTVHQNYRLPKTLTPTLYDVKVITHLGDDGEGFKFSGVAEIVVFCNETTSKIVLHSKNLTINEIDVYARQPDEKPGTKIEHEPMSIDNEYEFLTIPTKTALEKGQSYILKFKFEAELKEGLLGYYKSSYYDMKSKSDVHLAVTQFEATYARRALPCFDEPEFKAIFRITLGHKKKYIALSNMPVKSTTPMEGKDDWVWDAFEDTVPMSTYLVAYSINDFEFREAIVPLREQVIKFRVYARRDAIDQVDYALTVGPMVLKYFEKYFDVNFPLPKMDMIAIPDFSAGAMENWGLITYRETALLYHPNISSASSQYRVASVVAHELAHQWFGNLVTMKWWTDLWLNEGFATYVATLGVEHVQPNWNSLADDYVSQMTYVLSFDALKTSHPVSVEIENPSLISQIFDAISYQKGSSVIRMMHEFLGEETFRVGVSNYLKKHQFGNAEQDDLWGSLTEEAYRRGTLDNSTNVKDIMDTWTLQTGYPLISVKPNYEDNTIEVTQKRYLADKMSKSDSLNSEGCWSVPLSYTAQEAMNFNDTLPKSWLKCDNNLKAMVGKISNVAVKSDKWILFNIQLSGIYRVNYDNQTWKNLIKFMTTSNQIDQIHEINRVQIVDDALELAYTGEIDYMIPLQLIEYLKDEHEYIPWRQALSTLRVVYNNLEKTSGFGSFKKYFKKLIAPIYQKLDPFTEKTSPPDDYLTVQFKALIAAEACKNNVGDCLKKSVDLFDKWMSNESPDEKNSIPVDLRSIVYCNAIRRGDETHWDFLWQRYEKSNVAAEKALILSSLGCSRELWILQRYLEWILEPNSGIRKQDGAIVFSSIARNSVGYVLAKRFFFTKIQELYEYSKPDIARLGRYITPLARSIMTPDEKMEFKNFADTHSKLLEKASKSIDQGLEKIDINIQWHTNHYAKIIQYLKKIEEEKE